MNQGRHRTRRLRLDRLFTRSARAGLLATFVGVAVLLAAQRPALAQDDQQRADVARELRSAVAKLHDLRQDRLAQARELAEQETQLEQQITRLQGDVAEARARTQRAQQQLAELEAELASYHATIEQASRQIHAAAASAKDIASRLRQRAAFAIPDMRQNLGQIDAILEELSIDNSIAQADALAALHDFASDQLRRHRTIEMDNRLIEVGEPGVAKHGYVLRLGSVNELYLSEDGADAGVASRQNDAPWRSQLDANARRQVRDIIAIVRQQTPPGIVPVPTSAADEGAAP